MDPRAYKKQIEKEVEAARAHGSAPTLRRAPAGEEDAIRDMGSKILEDDAVFTKLLSQLADRSTSAKVRSTIVSAMQAQSFASSKFGALRPRWLAALRGLVDDPDTDLRVKALGLLSNENDGLAQDVLLRGLREPAKAVVPPETALQLLGSDVHAEVYPMARALAAAPPNEATRIEALRVLGADAESVPLFTKLLLDRKEAPAIRRLAIAALSSLSPASLRKHARDMAMATDEHPDVVATSLAALAVHDAPTPADMGDRVRELAESGTPEVKAAAERLLRKLPP